MRWLLFFKRNVEMIAFAKPLCIKLAHLQRHTTMALLLGLAASVLPAQAADITVEILPLSSTEGTVMVSLFDRPADFPRAGVYNQQITASRQVAGQPLLLVFTQLSPGRYAIAAFQDKDGNAKLNTNLMGVPNEPVDFSNNAKASFGPPSFDSAAFEVGPQGARVNLTLQ
jgi:uncharacterized protein (DUF2141 family)